MNTNEFINNEIDKKVNEFKERAKAKNYIMSETNEVFFRAGMRYGIMIASLALANIEIDEL